MSRRDVLLDLAVDHVLIHGLIGLSLRPLAAAIGTSDRMLLYHFGARDTLVTAIIAAANDRSIAFLKELAPAPSVRDGVLTLWRLYQCEPMGSCQQIYVQAAASGLLGGEPYRTDVRRANARWTNALSAWLADCGAHPDRVTRVTNLVDAGLLGLYVDLSIDSPEELTGAAEDLAHAAHSLAG